MKISRQILFAALFLLLPGGVFTTLLAQSRSVAPAERVFFGRLNLRDGLSNNTINDISQDRQGYLWVATAGGLNRYDGYRFRHFRNDPDNPKSISSNEVYTVIIDRKGTLWAGTSEGLNRLDPGKEDFVTYRVDRESRGSISGNLVMSLLEDASGNIWAGTLDGGLNKFDPETQTFSYYLSDPDNSETLSDNAIRALAEDEFGNIWIATADGGVNRLDPSNEIVTRYFSDPDDSRSLGSDTTSRLFVDSQGTVWVGTLGAGLNRFDPRTARFDRFDLDYSNPHSISADWVMSIAEDDTGTLWVGTWGGGLNRLDRTTNRFIAYKTNPLDPRSISSDEVFALFKDRSGLMWAGTAQGLNKFDANPPFIHVTRDPENRADFPVPNVLSMSEDVSGVVWLGTDGGGLSGYNPSTGIWERFGTDNSLLRGDTVLDVLAGREQTLWIAFDEAGIQRMNLTTRQLQPGPALQDRNLNLETETVLSLLEDTAGSLWLATARSGLVRLNPRTGASNQFFSGPSSPPAYFTTICQDEDGYIWAGTLASGLRQVNPANGNTRSWKFDSADPSSIASNRINDIACENGEVWVATSGGLSRYLPETNSFSRTTELQGLASNYVTSVLPDDEGRIWLASDRGLTRLNPNSGRTAIFSYENGLQENQFNEGAAFRSDDGTLFFGGVDGFNFVHPSRILPNTYVPPVVLSDIRVRGISRPDLMDEEGTLRLSYTDYFIEFVFSALDFRYPERNRYKVRMDGLDDSWQDRSSDLRSVSYSNLEGGRYVFRVQGSNGEGVWNEEGLSLRIVVTPPFWKHPLFIALVAILLAAGLFGLYRMRISKMEQERAEEIEIKQRLADSREAERLFIAQELHDGPIQDLHGVSYQLEALKYAPQPMQEKVTAQINDSVNQVNDELRTMCGELRPPALAPFGLARAIRSHSRRFKEKNPGLNIWLDLMDDEQRLKEEKRMALFRIYQESLNNVAQHSKASNAWITFKYDKEIIYLSIQDDGVGFHRPKRWVEFGRQSHYGLLGASERAEAVGGHLIVKSAPNSGTWVGVEVPRLRIEKRTRWSALWQS